MNRTLRPQTLGDILNDLDPGLAARLARMDRLERSYRGAERMKAVRLLDDAGKLPTRLERTRKGKKGVA